MTAKQAPRAPSSPFGMASRVGGENWNYVSNAAMVFAVLNTVLNGCVIGYFYGLVFGAVWTTAGSILLVTMIRLTMRISAGDEKASVPAMGCNVALIAMWVGAALLMWKTEHAAAMVLAATMCWSWIMHILLAGQRNKWVMAFTMGMPAVALLYFLISSSWIDYPFGVAMAASGSAIMMMAALAQSARTSHGNFNRLQKATGEAKAMRSKLEFAIESVGDGYFEINLDTMAYTPNPKFAESLGFTIGSHDARNLEAWIHVEDIGLCSQNLRDCRHGEANGWDQDVRVLDARGGHRWMAMRARVLTTDEGQRLLIGTLTDLTARKQMEADMLSAKEAAIASAKAKGEFLANMSHEIRTPLNGVLGMAQALDQSDLSVADKEKVSVILDSGKSLMALLNDVLDLSKIEAGKMEIAAVDEDFAQAMSRTRQLFQTQAEEKGLELTMAFDANFPRALRFDPVRVRQCVSNLLSNAIKFTSVGRVDVTVLAKPMGDRQHLVSVRIADTGIGMSADAVGRLFGVFEQADNSTTRRFGGSGLGLFISRQLARMMGGDISVESREGRGSTFTLTFRAQEAMLAKPVQPVAQSVGPRTSLRGVKVLLTDDNAINRQVIKLFLAPHGCEIAEAVDGRQALEKLAAEAFDLVLLDVHMPVMDGKEAIGKLRASGEAWAGLPVIALTADAMSGDRERYLALGMTDYISKPVDQRELVAKMTAVLGLAGAPVVVAKTGT